MEQAIDDAWQQQADAADIMEDGLRDIYVSALEESKYDSCELEEVHTLAEKAQQQALEPRSPRVRAILRDMKQLQDSLPVHPDAAIFIRQVRPACCCSVCVRGICAITLYNRWRLLVDTCS